MQTRPSYGLSFTNDGQITYIKDGKSYISDKNHAVILPKGQNYTIIGNKTGTFPVINFECSEFFTDSIIVLPLKDTTSVMKNFEHLKNMFFQKKSKLLLMSVFYNILYKITQSETIDTNPLSPGVKYIEKNYSSPISNSTLAKECLMGEEYFRKQFSKKYGLSPKQYVIDVRINKAKELLMEGSFKISAISEMCGFLNPNHFCRLFKQKTGLSPSDFMRQNQVYKI